MPPRNNGGPWHPSLVHPQRAPRDRSACSATRSPNMAIDIDTFEVVPAERVHAPAGDVTFPDPTGYDVIVPLGARWPVYDEALRQTWVGAEMQMLRDAADAGVPTLGVCFGGQLLAQAFGGSRRAIVASRRSAGTTSTATTRTWCPAGRGSSGTSTGGRCRPGPLEIARTANASQAFVLGRHVALQFHPELDRDLLESWLADDRTVTSRALACTHDELTSRRQRNSPTTPHDGSVGWCAASCRCRPSAVPELMRQRVARHRCAGTGDPAPVSFVGTTRWSASASSRAPWPPTAAAARTTAPAAPRGGAARRPVPRCSRRCARAQARRR